MLIVIPLALSSGAESICAKFLTSPVPYFLFKTIEIAAVVVVFPWSTCQIVPMLTCGLDLSNAIV